MANLVTFPFQNKEGKYFAPISCSEPDYIVVNGTIQANGEKITSGKNINKVVIASLFQPIHGSH